MISLIDLDILPYAYGGVTYSDGEVLNDRLLRKMVDEKIESIVEASGGEDWLGYLTDSPSNFRRTVATILPYKGNRDGVSKPPKWQMIREYLLEKDNVTLVSGWEADDQLAIDQTDNTIICTIDKDLAMVPGWHYNWNNDDKFFIDEVEGLRNFYKQLLTGDVTDNILGLFGVGPKSTLISRIDQIESETEMFNHVYEQYQKRFGSYAAQFIIENGTLLWMLRTPNIEECREFLEPYIEHYHIQENTDDIPF